MRRIVLTAYAAVAYLGFLATTLWSIAFVADLDVVTGIDHGRQVSRAAAVVIDLALLGIFALHHSVMARPAAKRALRRVLPTAAERSTYVLVADLLLALVLWQWRPVHGHVWNLTAQPWRGLVWAVYLLGWAIAIASTFMIDHFDLVGLRQATSHDYRPPQFQVHWLYVVVRHPLMLGLLVAFWVTPTMSAGHALFAVAASAYIAVGVTFEERDLRRELGAPYADYARRTPAIVPRVRRAN